MDKDIFHGGQYVTLPVSKSIGARFLVASFFAGTLPLCHDFDDCDDLVAIQSALRVLLLNENEEEGEVACIDVCASGTAFRFVAAVAASVAGSDFILTGTRRLCGRPMHPLLDVLREAGASVESLGECGQGPYRIKGKRLAGGRFAIRGDISSQFISALMLVAPSWEHGMILDLITPLVSRPYVEMTASVMRRFGIDVEVSDSHVEVNPGNYMAPDRFGVEADWSAASYFYAAMCGLSSSVGVAGLLPPGESLQGDAAAADLFGMLGIGSLFTECGAVVSRETDSPDHIEVDLTHNPDLMPSLAVGCLLRSVRFRFSGIRNLRLKECDRLLAMQTELSRLGYVVNVGYDDIEWSGEMSSATSDTVRTYDDHRIAMSLALMAMKGREVSVSHPEVVGKSFPDYWEQLRHVGLECRREGDLMRVIPSVTTCSSGVGGGD